MASRWFPLLFFLAFKVAGADDNDDNPYYTEGISGCIAENLELCYRRDPDWQMPCICGQDPSENKFLTSFAKCVGRDSPKDINSTYAGLAYDCSTSHLSVNLTRAEFEQVAMEGRDTEPAEPETSTSLSTGAIAGIAVGAIVGVGAMVGPLIWLLFKRRKNGNRLDSNPPSSPQQQTSSPHHQTSPSWGTEFKPEWTANAPVELPPSHHVPMYEMDATPMTPIEMPTSMPEEKKKELKKDEVEGQSV